MKTTVLNKNLDCKMSYITKEQVQAKTIKLKQLAKQYGIKLSVSGSNSSTIKVTIQEGKIDFFWNMSQCIEDTYYIDREYIQVNHYYLDKSFSGIALECLEKIKEVLFEDHWDESDVQSDYFNCSYYIAIHIGRYDKPYKVIYHEN